MAIMKCTSIIAIFAIYIVGQTETKPLYHLDFIIKPLNRECGQLTTALQAFWEALPDNTPRIHGVNRYWTVSKNNIYTFLGRRGFIDGQLDSPDKRMTLACALTGVKNISDLVPLYPWRQPEEHVRNAYNGTIEKINEIGIEPLKDSGEFAGLLKYAANITNFPNFPLYVYDMRMARDWGDRILEHLSLWNPDLELTEETKQMFANALMSNTSLEFQLVTGMSPNWMEAVMQYVNTYADMLKALSTLFTMFQEMGLLDLQ